MKAMPLGSGMYPHTSMVGFPALYYARHTSQACSTWPVHVQSVLVEHLKATKGNKHLDHVHSDRPGAYLTWRSLPPSAVAPGADDQSADTQTPYYERFRPSSRQLSSQVAVQQSRGNNTGCFGEVRRPNLEVKPLLRMLLMKVLEHIIPWG